MKKRIVTVYGTRPEAIKLAPVIRALENSESLDSFSVNTGQHRDMVAHVEELFDLPDPKRLEVMKENQSLNGIVTNVISKLDKYLDEIQPDAIIVQGDTSTAMAAALTAFNKQISVIHLEAGLRTGDIHSPFPEEANRKLISQITDLHLAPTSSSMDNLLAENVSRSKICVTGNTVIDALLYAKSLQIDFDDQKLSEIVNSTAEIVLVTSHRRENIDAMNAIGRAIGELADRFTDIYFVVPAHKNPNVRQALLPPLKEHQNVIITEPLPYGQFTRLIARSTAIMTDSGGVQEEAPSLGKPVLVMRENTERPEAVTAGTVRLVGTESIAIIGALTELLTSKESYQKMANAVNPYGDGRASARTIAAIEALFGLGNRIPDFEPQV